MRFFSKIVFICNLCFVASVILRVVENAYRKTGDTNGAVIMQPVVSTLVVLGYGAIIINFVFNFLMLTLLLLKKEIPVTRWFIWINLFLFIIQLYYFFL